jgi:hypothetical protein
LNAGVAEVSFQVEVQQRGMDLQVISDKTKSVVVPGFVSAVADFAFERMYQNTPWCSGFLAMSISKDVRKDGFSVKPTAPYAVFIEKGTGPHIIEPVNASCLAFESSSGVVFTKKVFHPGTKANPFVARTAAEVRSNLGKIFDEVWKREVGS